MKKIAHVSALLCCISYSLCAQSTSTHGNWYVGESIGAFIPKIAHNIYVGTGSGWLADRYHSRGIDSVADFSLLGGYRWSRDSEWLPFYSLSARYTSALPAKTRGTLFQFNVLEFNNYHYQYKVQRQNILGVAKVNLYNYHRFMPFITVGLGESINRMKEFSETPLSTIIPRTSPGFRNKSNHEFSYIIGAGIDYLLANNLWMGIEYHYGHYGTIQSGNGVGGFAAEHLKSTLTDNSIAYSINYFFDNAA